MSVTKNINAEKIQGNLDIASVSATTLTVDTGTIINFSAGTYQNLPLDVFVTGGTYDNGTIEFINNTGGTFNVYGLFTGSTDVFVTGGTYDNGTIEFINNTGGTFNVSGLFTGSTDVFVTGGTFNKNSETLSLNDTTGGTINITGFTDIFVTGGTYDNGTIEFINNTGGTFNVSGLFTGSTDVFVTGGTYNNGTIEFINNTGGTFSVTGITSQSGGVSISGGTFDKNTETLSLNDTTGGTINITGFTDYYTTGATISTGDTITFTRNDNNTYQVTLDNIETIFNFEQSSFTANPYTYIYLAPYNLQFNTANSSPGLNYTLTTTGGTYTLGTTLNQFDSLTVSANTYGLIILNGKKL